MIQIEDVSKTYGTTTVIRSLSLRIGPGETLALIGPSGCGKTTLLKMINRMTPLSTGVIRVGGVDVMDVDPVELRRGIGYVIQQIGLLPHLTVGQNISFVLKLKGAAESVRNARAEELIRLVGLPPEYLTKRPQQLSGGQQQRVGVARALAANPAVILMDEPFGATDPITRRRLQEMILDLQEKMRKTIVFVTHDIQEAMRIGHRVAVMDRGELVEVGTPAEMAGTHHPFVRELIREDGRCAR